MVCQRALLETSLWFQPIRNRGKWLSVVSLYAIYVIHLFSKMLSGNTSITSGYLNGKLELV